MRVILTARSNISCALAESIESPRIRMATISGEKMIPRTTMTESAMIKPLFTRLASRHASRSPFLVRV